MESAERRDYVERRRDRELQWVHELPRTEHRTSGAWVRESRRRRSHAVADDEVIKIVPERVLRANRLQRNLPSFLEIERLLELYVATGEGRGAYLAAKMKEEEETRYEGRHEDRHESIRRRRRYGSRPQEYQRSSSGSSDDHSDGDDDGLGGRPPHRPPSGGPSGAPPEAHIVQPDGRHRHEVREDKQDWVIRKRRRYGSRPQGHQTSSSGSSDDHSDGDDDGLGGRPPHRPPSGGPSGAPPEAHIVQPDGRNRRAVREDNRVWIPLQVVESGERRFLRAEEYDPVRQREYRPYYPGAAYIADRPRPIRRSRPSHVILEHNAEPVVPPPPRVPASPPADYQEVIIGPQEGQHHVDPRIEAHGALPAPAYPEELHIPPARRAHRYREAHRPPQPTVEDEPEAEEDLQFASLPSEEDDIRIQPLSRRQSREVRSSSVRMDRTYITRTSRTGSARRDHTYSARMSGARSAGRDRTYVMDRGGDGASYDFDGESDGDGPQTLRMRGGGPGKPLGKTSGIGAGVILDYNTVSKPIILYFFHVSRGRIISSRKPEPYITFQELRKNQPVANSDQLSDQWLVAKLQLHYWMINRRQQRVFWDLILMRTIGFATFIRFERTVKKSADAGNFVLTAKVPAVSSKDEAVSQFLYSMRYPLKSAKMMLFILDRLAGTTSDDDHCFYVVEIKETFDTSKIYVLLILLILISTGAGTAYSVVKSDPGIGLSIATYVLTCLSLILALVAAGQWLGLSKPDSFSFAYDWEENRVLSSTDADKIFGPGSGVT